jgi:Methylamine utilisation protein MauE
MVAAELQSVMASAVGLVFARSALSKIRNPWRFLNGVVAYRVLPLHPSYVVGTLLIPLEAMFAISHLSGWLLPVIVPVCVCVIGALVLVVALQLLRGHRVPCMCFDSSGDEPISYRTIARLGLLFTAELVLVPGRSAVQSGFGGGRSIGVVDWLMALAGAIAVLIAAQWLLNASDLLKLWQDRRLFHTSEGVRLAGR